MELHVVRPIFILLLWGFTLGLKADDLSVIRQKYIESILYKNKSETAVDTTDVSDVP